MGANSVPRFIELPIAGTAQISTANSNRDGTGTMATVVTGTKCGTLIRSVRVVATGTTTAGMVRLFLDDGSSVRLWKELTVSAVTASATVAAYEKEFEPGGTFILPDSVSIKAATEKSETFNVFVFGGDY